MNMRNGRRLARVYWDVENTHDIRQAYLFPKAIKSFFIALRSFLIGRQVEIERKSRAYLRARKRHSLEWKEAAERLFDQGDFMMRWARGEAEGLLVRDVLRVAELAKTPQPLCTYPLPPLVVIISGDADVMDAVRALKRVGREVWAISLKDSMSPALVNEADQYFSLEDDFPQICIHSSVR